MYLDSEQGGKRMLGEVILNPVHERPAGGVQRRQVSPCLPLGCVEARPGQACQHDPLNQTRILPLMHAFTADSMYVVCFVQ